MSPRLQTKISLRGRIGNILQNSNTQLNNTLKKDDDMLSFNLQTGEEVGTIKNISVISPKN